MKRVTEYFPAKEGYTANLRGKVEEKGAYATSPNIPWFIDVLLPDSDEIYVITIENRNGTYVVKSSRNYLYVPNLAEINLTKNEAEVLYSYLLKHNFKVSKLYKT